MLRRRERGRGKGGGKGSERGRGRGRGRSGGRHGDCEITDLLGKRTFDDDLVDEIPFEAFLSFESDSEEETYRNGLSVVPTYSDGKKLTEDELQELVQEEMRKAVISSELEGKKTTVGIKTGDPRYFCSDGVDKDLLACMKAIIEGKSLMGTKQADDFLRKFVSAQRRVPEKGRRRERRGRRHGR